MKCGPYEFVIAPKNYPGKKYRGRYAYEHQVVYWQYHKKIAPKGYVIHHINGKKRDNHIDNLHMVKMAVHSAEHSGMHPWEGKCGFCNKTIFRRFSQYRFLKKRGQQLFFCSARCGALNQHKLTYL